jgi:hypothetical protein
LFVSGFEDIRTELRPIPTPSMKLPKSKTPIPKVIITLLPRGWDERSFSLLFSERGTAVYDGEEEAMVALLEKKEKVEFEGISLCNRF